MICNDSVKSDFYHIRPCNDPDIQLNDHNHRHYLYTKCQLGTENYIIIFKSRHNKITTTYTIIFTCVPYTREVYRIQESQILPLINKIFIF